MFVRFVTTEIHPNSHLPMGVFATAYRLLRSDGIDEVLWFSIRWRVDWFCDHLPAPAERHLKDARTIHWFRDDASECIRRAWSLAAVVREAGHDVLLVRTKKPGYVTYADRWQVAAVPYRDTRVEPRVPCDTSP